MTGFADSQSFPAPVFVGGFVRTGTTLLRSMLACHPAFASGLETHWFAVDWQQRLGRNGEPLDEWLTRLANFFNVDETEVYAMANASDSAPVFLSRFLSAHAAHSGKRRWIEKTPDNIRHIGRIFENWPDAMFIHMLRDPRDCYISLRDTGKLIDIDSFARDWCRWLKDADTQRKKIGLTDTQYREVRYEMLVAEPEQVLREIISFLDEPWDVKVAQFNGMREDFDKVYEITGHRSRTLERLGQPLDDTRIAVWRNALEESEAHDLHDAIARHGGDVICTRLESSLSALLETPEEGGRL